MTRKTKGVRPFTWMTSNLQLSLWDGLGPAVVIPAPDEKHGSAAVSHASGLSVARDRDPVRSNVGELFARVHRRLGLRRPDPVFRVSFQRFTSLRSTIRSRHRGLIEAYLSDILEEASTIVLEAIAEILITRLYRVATSREAHECYEAWAQSPAIARRTDEIRRQRGRKILRAAQGSCFNLRAIFEDLNSRWFSGEITGVRIGWSVQRSRTMLGHYDASHHTITVTRWLDRPGVPRYVVEYLVYHEMLHAKFPVERHAHRRVVHSRAFREAERRFPHYTRALQWLKGGSKLAARPSHSVRRALEEL
jgi:hypothetical protein